MKGFIYTVFLNRNNTLPIFIAQCITSKFMQNFSQDSDVSIGATNCHLQAIIFLC